MLTVQVVKTAGELDSASEGAGAVFVENLPTVPRVRIGTVATTAGAGGWRYWGRRSVVGTYPTVGAGWSAEAFDTADDAAVAMLKLYRANL